MDDFLFILVKRQYECRSRQKDEKVFRLVKVESSAQASGNTVFIEFQ